jgi:hypothetical protein
MFDKVGLIIFASQVVSPSELYVDPPLKYSALPRQCATSPVVNQNILIFGFISFIGICAGSSGELINGTW